MSKVRLHAGLADNVTLDGIYTDPLRLTLHSKTSATFVEAAAGPDKVTLEGTGFSDAGHDIVAGEVDKVVVITDFDADGGSDKQDLISLNASFWSAHQSGHDTVIEFGDGDTLTLLNVRRSHISDADVFLTFEG